MQRVLCCLPNASSPISGVVFTTVEIDGDPIYVSEHIADDAQYRRFLSIPGYAAWEGNEEAHGATIEIALEKTADGASGAMIRTTSGVNPRPTGEERRRQSIRPRKLAAAVRRPLERRIAEAEARLKKLGIKPKNIWRRLLPFVEWLSDTAYILSDAQWRLEPALGPRWKLLDVPIDAPDPKELADEVTRVTAEGVDPQAVITVAHLRIMQRRMLEQGRHPGAEREMPAWEAATGAAVAAKALSDPRPAVLAAQRAYFVELDRRCAHDEERHDHSELKRADRQKQSNAGRRRAAQKPANTRKRNELMKKDYIVGRIHDGMTRSEAMASLMKKYELSREQVCRSIGPQELERNLRPSRATAQIRSAPTRATHSKGP